MRLVIIEDQLLVRQSLEAVVSARLIVSRWTSFASCAAALGEPAILKEGEVALIDIHLENECAFDYLEAIRAAAPALKIIFLTGMVTDYDLHRAEAAGVHGAVHKNEPLEILVSAIQEVGAGKRVISPHMETLFQRSRQRGVHFDKVLSAREQELMPLLGCGLSNEEVGAMAGLSPATVKVHRRNIMSKMDLHSAADLVTYAMRTGFVQPSGLMRPVQSGGLEGNPQRIRSALHG
jgi:DNA-binding NarL/FixJ family response regulator